MPDILKIIELHKIDIISNITITGNAKYNSHAAITILVLDSY
jgi:hypothetical protein